MEAAPQVFFQKEFAKNNNWGFVVGFDANNLLLLEKKPRTDEWELRPISVKEIVRINVRQYRSIYLYCVGVITAFVGVVIAWAGLDGSASGIGIFTIPLICAGITYYTFTGGKRIRFDFETKEKSWKYKSEPGNYDETYSMLPQFINWAKARQLRLTVEFPVEAVKKVA